MVHKKHEKYKPITRHLIFYYKHSETATSAYISDTHNNLEIMAFSLDQSMVYSWQALFITNSGSRRQESEKQGAATKKTVLKKNIVIENPVVHSSQIQFSLTHIECFFCKLR